MSTASLALILLAAATVAVVHSVLPDHWVPLAVVGRTQRWSLLRVARISGLAAGGHVVASLLLAGVVALVGLRFQRQIDAQQGHIVGGVLVLAGLGFLAWGLTGRGHGHPHGEAAHEHGSSHGHEASHEHGQEAPHDHGGQEAFHEHGGQEAFHAHGQEAPHDHGGQEAFHEHGGHEAPHERDPHEHGHAEDVPVVAAGHEHEHEHGEVRHSHAHHHDVFIEEQQQALLERSRLRTPSGLLATIAVPFGVAASPDLTILPVALAASAYGAGAVVSVLGIFAVVTMAAFVGLTVTAAAVGYQVRGEWLERHATTVTALVLVAIGVVAFVGL